MILFYLTEAFRIFRKSYFATIVTIFITVTAISLICISYFLYFISNKLSADLKKSVEVNIYVDDNLATADLTLIQNQLMNQTEVESVEFISKEIALNDLLKETGEDFKKVLDENPLPNSFILKFRPEQLNEISIESFVEKYKNMKGVIDVNYDYKTILKLLTILKSSEKIIYSLSLILGLLAIYIVFSNNRAQIANNKDAYKFMICFGSKISSMKIPVIINGIMIGIISSAICLVFFNVSYSLLIKVYNNLKFINEFHILNLLIIVMGVSLGFIGSFVSSFKISKIIELN
jgi:cell division transport system permease protein